MPFTPTTWLDAVTVNTTTTGIREDARVTVLSNGNILISWTATTEAPGEPDVSNIVGQIMDPLGNPVNGEFIINVGSEGHFASNSDIQATADGGFFAVFERNQAGLEDVLIIRFDASGTPSPSGNLFFDVTLSGANPSGFDPQVAVASETSGLAVWRETTESGESILRGFVFDASSPASAAINDSNLFDLATVAGIQGEPAVVAMANGSYAVAVGADVDGGNQIRLYIVNEEGGVSNAQDAVIGETGVVDMAPSLTRLGDRFVMTWSADGVIQVQLFNDRGNTVGAQNSIPGLTVGEGDRPVVQDLGGNHYAVVVIDSSTSTIHVQRFDVTGAPVGARGVFHTADADSPPDLALMPDGRLVVTFIDASGQVAMEILDTRDATGEAGTMITGTVGSDVITYEGPATYVGGGAGDDTINATPTDPFRTFDGGDGNDRINVGSRVNGDIYLGGRGADTIDWSGSDEFGLVIDLAAGTATDEDGNTETMLSFRDAVGTSGDDHIIGDDGDNALEGLGGADLIEGGAGDDVLRGGDGDDTLDGGDGADILFGGDGDDTLDGGDGDDMLVGGAGADTFIGGAGNDTVNYFDASTGVYADLLFNNAQLGAEGDSFSGIENLIGSAFNDTLLGGDVDNVLRGGDGNDVLIGDGGDDILRGDGGDDELFGGNGNDTLVGGEGDDYMEDSAGENIFDGGEGFDIASYDEFDEDVQVDLSTGVNNQGDTLISIEGVMGGDGNDELTGDEGDNEIYGSNGDDWIAGGGGADLLNGGSGDFDTVDYRTSSAGVVVSLLDNTASGGDAEGDTISGFENVFGSAFADTLTGDARDNYIEGFGGADVLTGGAGLDTLSYFSSSGGVTVSLLDNTASRGDAEGDVFSGFENILGSVFDDVLTGDAGANVIRGWDGNDLLLGEDGDDELDGGEGDDDLRGGAGADTLVGGAGNDRLRSGEGSGDVLIGGEGDDNYYIDSLGAQVIEVGGEGFDRVYSTVTFNGSGQDIERMAIIGEANANILGNDLDNTLIGNDASNGLNGGLGADVMQGRGGNDVYTVDNAGDVVLEYEGGGVDLVRSSVSFDASATHVENITLTGSALIDAVGNDLNNIIIGNGAANLINGGGGVDRMEGLGGDDTYVVDSRDDVVVEVEGGGVDTVLSSVSFDGRFTHVENITLTGSANANAVGNDLNNLIIGNSAANILKGLGGDDTYVVDSRDDVVVEAAGGGVDTVQSMVSFDARTTHVENITLIGTVNANVVANDLNNIIIGNDAANILKGMAGDDVMEGLGGNDTYEVDSRGDVVVEVAGGGIDTVLSSVSFDARTTHVENITLTGAANANAVANDLNNTIIGNSAANIIIGNGGADVMTGGGGADTFRFSAVSDSTFSAYDRIMDLGNDDFIDLRSIDANTGVAGNQSFTQVDELTGEAGQMTLDWLPSAGFTLMSMDVDGDGVADMRIVLYGDHSDFDNFLGVGG